jgi:hypothetical protein
MCTILHQMNIRYDSYKLTNIDMHEKPDGSWALIFTVCFFLGKNMAFFQRYSTDPTVIIETTHIKLDQDQVDAMRLFIGTLDSLVESVLPSS